MGYLFDRDFDQEIEREQAETDRLAVARYTQEELDAALAEVRAAGAEEGRALGRQEAFAEAEETDRRRKVEALEALAPRVESLLQSGDAHQQALESQVVRFASSVFEKVIPEVMRSRAAARAEDEVRAALAIALGSSTVRVYLPPDAAAAHGLELEEAATAMGHGGRVEVFGDGDLKDGDARVEWDNGFMEYSFGVICERILTALRAAAAKPGGIAAAGSRGSDDHAAGARPATEQAE